MNMFLDDIASCHAVSMTSTGVFTTLLDIPIATPAGEKHFWVSVSLELHAVAHPPVWDSFVLVFGRLLLNNFQTNIKDGYLEQFLWNSPQEKATRPFWWLVNIGFRYWLGAVRQQAITWANLRHQENFWTFTGPEDR